MAASLSGVFESDLQEKILKAKIFVVGAGGIGCELLKNLVLVGFQDIEVIDLDTIDVSNLNRQFLFHKQHVGKSKAAVATESALQFNPNVKIKHYHDSVISNEYNVSFYKRFDVVLNALDNVAARTHVNRMCLAAGVPLVESGTAGYEGQVELIQKGVTQCYECEVKRVAKTYPGCTIRNTPSEPIHCIVWAKHLFNQLFGESDADEEVSPDAEDPELAGQGGSNGNVVRKSTREWAEESNYDHELLFHKLFRDDIKYLLTMDKLWVKRRAPTPLDINNVPDAVAGSSKEVESPGLKEMKVWSVAECVEVFKKAVSALKAELKSQGDKAQLIWDKDDPIAMDFVAACANIRAHIFAIEMKTRFEIKSMAGNIIPAIATTNAIVAGVVVLRLLEIIREKFENCSTVYLRMKPNLVGQMVVPEKKVTPPNPKCPTCGPDPQVILACNTNKMTIGELEEAVLKKTLNMVAPDAHLPSTGNVIISSEEGETEENRSKTLSEMQLVDDAVIKVDDFLQNYELKVIIKHYEAEKDKPEFFVDSDGKTFGPKPEEEKDDIIEEDNAEPMIVDEQPPSGSKRKHPPESSSAVSPPKKRLRDLEIDPDVIVL